MQLYNICFVLQFSLTLLSKESHEAPNQRLNASKFESQAPQDLISGV